MTKLSPRTAFGCLVTLALALVLPIASSASRQEESATGQATYYSDRFQGRLTASGEPFDQEKLTAAHNGHPFGTRLRVTNLANDRSVFATVNDRLGATSTALIDLTRRAAQELDFIEQGRATVRVDVVTD